MAKDDHEDKKTKEAEDAFGEVIYGLEAYVFNIRHNEKDARPRLQAYTNMAALLVENGYIHYAQDLVSGILDKATECGFEDEEWMQRFKKKPGVFSDNK